ncbi:hypothetical protein HZR84_03820 [Hyphobacterium sp. CCMP332]|nr:hypothetical protein HZR84_03820 [Hyphobacterium sp. CCMP332]
MRIIACLLLTIFMLGCNNSDDDPDLVCNDPTNPNCPNFDPCFNKFPTTADFSISKQLGFTEPWNEVYVIDTVFFGGIIRFRAMDSLADTYKWYLGAEIIEGGPELFEIERSFFAPLQPGIYNAALVTSKTADQECFPNDTGIDSVFREFVIKDNTCEALVINKFKGTFDDAITDTVVIELLFAFNRIPTCDDDKALHAVNFFGNQDTIFFNGSLVGFTNRRVQWSTNNPNSDPVGYLEIDSLNNVRAEYEFMTKKTFTGKIFN